MGELCICENMHTQIGNERRKTYRPHKGKGKDRCIVSIRGELSIRDGRAGDVQTMGQKYLLVGICRICGVVGCIGCKESNCRARDHYRARTFKRKKWYYDNRAKVEKE